MKIVQFTSVHPRGDVRIFLKECRSLLADGHDVTLLVADGQGNDLVQGVRVVDSGLRSRRRIARALFTGARIYRAARAMRADIYHFHDPELLPWAVLLRIQGCQVIYDAHEHVGDDILAKPYLSKRLARILAATIGPCEVLLARTMSAVVTATPGILERFAGRVRICVGVYNFPLENELQRSDAASSRELLACYVGGISNTRGVRQLAQAAAYCRTKIVMAGPLWEGLTQESLASVPGWDRVRYLGFVGRDEVARLMGSARVGVVTFLPAAHHVDSLPNKLFEYMSAGIAVVASDFPLWKSVVEKTHSGICVDPCDPRAIAAAIDRLAHDEAFATICGQNGMNAVAEEYNWNQQAVKLKELYRRLTGFGAFIGVIDNTGDHANRIGQWPRYAAQKCE
jgi:glycosyltransferase involved in cell wall biosynthesis